MRSIQEPPARPDVPAASAAISAVQPTTETERLHALDAIRGAAILGVLFAYAIWNLGGPPEETWTALDHFIARFMDVFVDSKCYTLFACLFGLGVAQQWRRWEAAGQDPLPLHVRRMGFLLVVGVLHALLLRNGDILAPYAICGLVLFLFRSLPTRAIAVASVVALVAHWAVAIVAARMGHSWPARPEAASGNYFADNWAWLRYWYATGPLLYWPETLGLMLSGVWAARATMVEQLSTSPKTPLVLGAAAALAVLTRIAVDTFHGVGLASWLRPTARQAIYEWSAWSLAAAYAITLILILRRNPSRLWPLRATGRMAFTNYLMQPVVIVPLCLAFGLFDTITPSRGLWIALPLGALQVAFSVWWLRRHSLGPLEWLWRRVTYGRAPWGLGARRSPGAG